MPDEKLLIFFSNFFTCKCKDIYTLFKLERNKRNDNYYNNNALLPSFCFASFFFRVIYI